jgi:hypothetical protein
MLNAFPPPDDNIADAPSMTDISSRSAFRFYLKVSLVVFSLIYSKTNSLFLSK